MLVEATGKALTYRWPAGEVHLEPGKPVDLPDDRARRLLEKAPGKVRVVERPPVKVSQTPRTERIMAPAGACWACGQARFWVSIQDRLVCGVCHPPADPAL